MAVAMKAPAKVEVTLTFTKATKHTYRFDSPTEGLPVTSLYVAQSAFTKQPKAVKVTVEAA